MLCTNRQPIQLLCSDAVLLSAPSPFGPLIRAPHRHSASDSTQSQPHNPFIDLGLFFIHTGCATLNTAAEQSHQDQVRLLLCISSHQLLVGGPCYLDACAGFSGQAEETVCRQLQEGHFCCHIVICVMPIAESECTTPPEQDLLRQPAVASLLVTSQAKTVAALFIAGTSQLQPFQFVAWKKSEGTH